MSVSRVTEKVMHGLTGGGWKRKHPATVNRGGTAWRETTGTQAPGPTAGQRHRASRPPYSLCGRLHVVRCVGCRVMRPAPRLGRRRAAVVLERDLDQQRGAAAGGAG